MTENPSRPAAPRRVTILGSTGSVGCNTVELVAADPDAYAVEALAAQRNVEKLAEQARAAARQARRRRRRAAIPRPEGRRSPAAASRSRPAPQAVVEAAARPADWVMAAIVGAAGLAPTLAAVRQRRAWSALANKEVLVCAGALVTAAARRHGARLLPVDSEHNAIFQVFDVDQAHAIERIVLTASGGPFRERPLAEMAAVTPEQAVAHPNWSMGAKISVDSATMMNKGLEVIEAHHLFDLPTASASTSSCTRNRWSTAWSITPTARCWRSWARPTCARRSPMRSAGPTASPRRARASTWRELGRLTFEPPDPCASRRCAWRARRSASGGGAPTVLNAANEVAVAAFLDGRIGFLDIAAIVGAHARRAARSPHRQPRRHLRHRSRGARCRLAPRRQRRPPRRGRIADKRRRQCRRCVLRRVQDEDDRVWHPPDATHRRVSS